MTQLPDINYQILTPEMVKEIPHRNDYDEESLQYYQVPQGVNWWNKNKQLITKFILGGSLVVELGLLFYISIFEPISNVLID